MRHSTGHLDNVQNAVRPSHPIDLISGFVLRNAVLARTTDVLACSPSSLGVKSQPVTRVVHRIMDPMPNSERWEGSLDG